MHKNPFLLEKQYSAAAAGALHLKDFLPGVPGDTIFFFLTRSPKDALFSPLFEIMMIDIVTPERLPYATTSNMPGLPTLRYF